MLLSSGYFALAASTIPSLIHAASFDRRHTPNLRPRFDDYTERTQIEALALSKRETPLACGDASGAQLDISALVADSIKAGLPSASASGVIFMRASVADAQGCGPYQCYVSTDATGQSWSEMTIVQNVPGVQDGCAAGSGSSTSVAEETEYPLVAQLAKDTTCTGQAGACLVLCKIPAMQLGNCAAVQYKDLAKVGASSSSDTINSTSDSANTPHAVTITSQVDATRYLTTTRTLDTTPAALPSAKIPSSTPSSTATSTIETPRPFAGFSGENGPGGPAEQHINFGVGLKSATVDEDSASQGKAEPNTAAVKSGALALIAALAALLLSSYT